MVSPCGPVWSCVAGLSWPCARPVGREGGGVCVCAVVQVERTLEGHTNLVLSVAYSPSGDQLASGSRDKPIKLWNLRTGAVRPLYTRVWVACHTPHVSRVPVGVCVHTRVCVYALLVLAVHPQ